jgi:hypothetical protein
MRYMPAVLLALGIGITTAVTTALDSGPGHAYYRDGVVSNRTLPAPLYPGTGARLETAVASKFVIDEGPITEVSRTAGKLMSQMSPADSGYATSPSNLTPGFNTGYGTVVSPARPLWDVQFPL